MQLPDPFEVRTDMAGQAAVISVTGELDIDTAPRLRLALAHCLQASLTSLTVDLSGVAFCDCAGLNVLIGARRSADAAGIPFHLSGLGRQVTKLLKDTGTAGLFREPPDRHGRGHARPDPAARVSGVPHPAGDPRAALA
ncbi:STAS domain-containing protein [Streptomyces sp. 8N616]|uniref:STAS domain-containing protein n=1 Tax=Streptomyces sp. 8N616 TaxID=3457414 RepID=UPI003FD4725C